MATTILAAALFLSLPLAATTPCGDGPSAAVVAAANADASGPVIVHVVSRRQVITASAGPNGPLYSARQQDGTVLVANATLAELHANHPEIYRQLNPSVAVDVSFERSSAISPSNIEGQAALRAEALGLADAF